MCECKCREKVEPKTLSREEFEAARLEYYEGADKIPYERDWEVTEVIDHGPFEEYRYETRGINHNVPAGVPGHHFSWRVPNICWRYFMA